MTRLMNVLDQESQLTGCCPGGHTVGSLTACESVFLKSACCELGRAILKTAGGPFCCPITGSQLCLRLSAVTYQTESHTILFSLSASQ